MTGVATGANDLLQHLAGLAHRGHVRLRGYTTTTEVLDFDLDIPHRWRRRRLEDAASGTLRAPFVTRSADKYEACFRRR